MAAVRAKSHTGFPSVAQDYFSSDFSFDANIITHPDTTFIMRINGSSMEGAGIFDGDIILVDRSLTPEHDDIVVITYEGELLLRRLTTNNQGNPVLSTYAMHDKDIHLYFDESITLWGVIIGSYHPQHSSVRNIRG
ncbi:translesion error-prone DNA polymerase V autoproteolytic subunit [Alloscardovia omnicolens]|nr:translesion error-prone DNA polymerase V autoproteolytic subunit [Alloscardovia omnicolens]MDK6249769.1 translesion error-prone DNA polymerase V autoproteolytic subunit [Alloscardovia omnicolens]